jgi:hypothetical protein
MVSECSIPSTFPPSSARRRSRATPRQQIDAASEVVGSAAGGRATKRLFCNLKAISTIYPGGIEIFHSCFSYLRSAKKIPRGGPTRISLPDGVCV